MNNKIRYLLKSLSKVADKQRLGCPSCASHASTVVSRKYIFTALRRCNHCKLLFRTPTTTSAENASFYQEAYSQGFTTDAPDDVQLEKLTSSNFAGSDKDYTNYIKCLQAFGAKPGDRLLDFGCSWGYGSWQLQKHGFKVTAFEISKPRCRYAREKLNVNAFDKLSDLPNEKFDVFFSSHVLEHVPSVSDIFKLAREKLTENGVFVAYTPNGSAAFQRRQPDSWKRLWGMVHPNFLDDEFYRNAFPTALLASDPYDFDQLENAWEKQEITHLSLEGRELLAAFRIQ